MPFEPSKKPAIRRRDGEYGLVPMPREEVRVTVDLPAWMMVAMDVD